MLPLKWKIFRVVTYLHMMITAVLAAIAIVAMAETRMRFQSLEDLLIVLIIFLIPATLLSNSSINILLLERYYPDRLPGKVLIRFSYVLFILSAIIVAGTLLLAAAAITDVFFDDSGATNTPATLLLTLAIAAIGLTGCYILWAQVLLRKALRRNHDSAINNFLVSDEL